MSGWCGVGWGRRVWVLWGGIGWGGVGCGGVGGVCKLIGWWGVVEWGEGE